MPLKNKIAVTNLKKNQKVFNAVMNKSEHRVAILNYEFEKIGFNQFLLF